MIGLVDLLDEPSHRDAVAYDLMRCGKNLRDWPDNGVTWGDLHVLVTKAQPGSAVFSSMNPSWQHTHELELARSIDHSLRWLVWAKTKDAAANRNAPDPYRFPWEPAPPEEVGMGGADSMTLDEVRDFLGWENELRE